MRRKCQLSVKSCVICQLSGCYYLTEDLKPLLGQFSPQFFERMYTGINHRNNCQYCQYSLFKLLQISVPIRKNLPLRKLNWLVIGSSFVLGYCCFLPFFSTLFPTRFLGHSYLHMHATQALIVSAVRQKVCSACMHLSVPHYSIHY